jgi:hypothetical protein
LEQFPASCFLLPVPSSPTRLVLAIILIGTALRIVLAAAIGLGVDESYAVAVGREFSLSYFDHSPLSFWIPGLVAWLGGGGNAVLLRLPFILLFVGTTWLMFRVGARLFGERAGMYGALALTISPVFSISTGGWVLPDGPLMFFMLASVLCLAQVLFSDPPVAHPLRWWLAAGAMAGLALLSKYSAVFLLAGTLLYLATERRSRRWLRRPEPYLAALSALLMCTPVLVWNARHEWISFRFQGARGAPSGVHPLALLQSLGGQAGYILPWIWLPLIWLLVVGVLRGPREPRRWLLCCLALGPIVAFTLPALGGNPGLPHWAAPGYLMLFPLLGAAIDAHLGQGRQGPRLWLATSTAAFLLLVALMASQTATGWISRRVPTLFARGDPTLEAVDWRDLRRALHTRGLIPGPDRFVAATNWIDAGKAAYALGPNVPVLCLCAHPHQFGFLHDQARYLGDDALIIERIRGTRAMLSSALAPYFDHVDFVALVPILRAGHPALTLAVYLGHRFRRAYPTADLGRTAYISSCSHATSTSTSPSALAAAPTAISRSPYDARCPPRNTSSAWRGRSTFATPTARRGAQTPSTSAAALRPAWASRGSPGSWSGWGSVSR